MNLKIFILLALASYANACCFPDADLSLPARTLHDQFIDKCRGGAYTTGDKEVYFQIFQDNLARIIAGNKAYTDKGLPAPFGLTGFSDWTKEQFELSTIIRTGEKGFLNERLHDLDTTDSKCLQSASSSFTGFSKNLTYRDNGCISRLKWQGNCASDYAFTVADTLADNHCIATGEYCELSAQNLIDCSTTLGNLGCRGGFIRTAMDYIEANGIMRRDQYDYTKVQGQCKFDPSKAIHKSSGAITYLSSDTENAIRQELDFGRTLMVSVDVRNWQFICGDVIIGRGNVNNECCKADENKYIQIIGYGKTLGGTPYWIFKNTWGWGWGDRGYGKLIAGQNCYQLRRKSFPNRNSAGEQCTLVGPPMKYYDDEGSGLPEGPPQNPPPSTVAPFTTKSVTEEDYVDTTELKTTQASPPPTTTQPPKTTTTTSMPKLPTTPTTTTEPASSTSSATSNGCTNKCGQQSKWRLIWKMLDSMNLDAEECEV